MATPNYNFCQLQIFFQTPRSINWTISFRKKKKEEEENHRYHKSGFTGSNTRFSTDSTKNPQS